MNIARQMLAVSIVFIASRFIVERSLIKFLIFVSCAIFFHHSAVVSIALYFFGSKNNGVKKSIRVLNVILPIIIVIFMGSLIRLAININILSQYEVYGDSVVSEMNLGWGFLGLLIMVLVFTFTYKAGKLRCSENMQNFIFPISTFAPVLFLLEYKLDNFAGRISLYIMIFQILFLSLLKTAGSQQEGIKFDYQLLSYAFAGVIFVYTGLIQDGQGCFPYKLWTGM
jgi:transmembrane protein EpsG